jgi:hypothetical protein
MNLLYDLVYRWLKIFDNLALAEYCLSLLFRNVFNEWLNHHTSINC